MRSDWNWITGGQAFTGSVLCCSGQPGTGLYQRAWQNVVNPKFVMLPAFQGDHRHMFIYCMFVPCTCERIRALRVCRNYRRQSRVSSVTLAPESGVGGKAPRETPTCTTCWTTCPPILLYCSKAVRASFSNCQSGSGVADMGSFTLCNILNRQGVKFLMREFFPPFQYLLDVRRR